MDDAAYVLNDHEGSVFVVSSNSRGRNLLASGGSDDTGMIWDLDVKKQVAKIDGMGESVISVEFSYDGQYCGFGAMNGAVVVASLEEEGKVGRITLEEAGEDAVEFIAWHPRGPVMLIGSSDTTCRMWNVANQKFMACFAGHGSAVTCGGFSSDGKLVITGSGDGSVRIWAPKDAQCLVNIANGIASVGRDFHRGGIICMAIGSAEKTEKLVLTGADDGTVRLSHIETGRIVAQLPNHDGSVETVAMSGQQLSPHLAASGGTDGKINIWDIERSMTRCTVNHEAAVTRIRWHPTLHQIVSTSVDGTVRIFDAKTGKELDRLQGHSDGALDVCIIPTLNAVASASDDKTVRLYDIRK